MVSVFCFGLRKDYTIKQIVLDAEGKKKKRNQRKQFVYKKFRKRFRSLSIFLFYGFQITFDAFTVGNFVSYIVDGCPDGYMTIRENDLPNIGGQWCGSALGYTVYYSESSSLNLTLFLSRLLEQVIHKKILFNCKFESNMNFYLTSAKDFITVIKMEKMPNIVLGFPNRHLPFFTRNSYLLLVQFLQKVY